MTVTRCHLCDSETDSKHRFQDEGLVSGRECPVCYAPTCQFHLTTVRWRWKNGGGVGSERVCKECKRTYRYRSWDTLNRDWIS